MKKNSLIRMESPISLFLKKENLSPEFYLEKIRVQQDEVIFFRRLGTLGFYSIADGHFCLEFIKENKVYNIRICGPGDMVGFGIWYYGEKADIYYLKSFGIGEIHFLPQNKFLELSRNIPLINELITEELCHIQILKDEQISALENQSVKKRVALLLLNLCSKFGVETPEGKLIDLKIDRATLSCLAGTTVESFSRMLTDFENQKIIQRKRRKIIIKCEKLLSQC